MIRGYHMFDFLCYTSSESLIPKQGPISCIRILHASPTGRRVDVYSNGRLISKGLGYRKYTPYLNVPSGTHNINLYPAGHKTNLITYENITLEPGCIYTAIIAEYDDVVELVVVTDPMLASSEDMSRIRFVHLSPDLISMNVCTFGNNLISSGLNYKDVSDYVSLKPDKYTFQIKTADSEHIILTVPEITLKPGWNYTAYAVGFLNKKPGFNIFILLDGNTYINF